MYLFRPRMKILVNISETFILRGLNKNPKAAFIWTLDLFEVVPYTEEPFSHHWFTPQPPRIQRSLFNGPPTPPLKYFCSTPKKVGK